MAHLGLSFLGPWQVTLMGEAVTGFKYDKVRALLAYLAVEADRPHRREAIMGLLWPELPQTAARNNLRQVLLILRQALADQTADPPFLLTSRATLQFNAESDHALDVAAFAELLAACRRHPHRQPTSCHACARRLQQAVALYRGPFLAEFFLPDSTAFEEWALLKREWLQRQMLEALAWLTAYYEQRGQYEQARHTAWQQLELEPWLEAAHRQLMRLHLLSGDRNAALAQYEQCRRLLADELAVDPEPETTALYEQIRDATEEVPLLPKRLALPADRPHTLPPQPTPFVGREAELAQIGRLLDSADCHLITLIGPGGTGKTRLALQAATEHLDAFADGIFFVPLAGLASPDMLAGAIAQALLLARGTTAGPQAHLLNYLRHKEMLLVLDNFEHLLSPPLIPPIGGERGGERGAEAVNLLAEIQRQATDVTLLVTSRERLNLQGEWVFIVDGLSIQEESSDAAQLFVQGARRVRADFVLAADNLADVVRICRLVSGLPLAIELAAAWVRLLSCAEIAAEIEQSINFLHTTGHDVPERHRSVAAVFDHSWRLLTAEEQTVLPRLALFHGGFRRQAAAQVAGASLPILAALVDKSLLQWNPNGRYTMHELIRHYALAKLLATGEMAAMQVKFFDYFLDWAQTAETHLVGAEIAGWLEQFEAEKENLRAALAWVLAEGTAESGLQLVAALWWYWYTRGYFSEGRGWLAQALAREETAVPSEARAKALSGAGVLAWNQGDYALARHFYEESLAIKRASGDQLAVSAQLNNLGNLALDEGDYEMARRYHEESLELKRGLADGQGIAISLGNLGIVAFKQGDYETARAFYEESLALKRELADQRGISITLGNLGNVLFEQGDYAAARALLQESLEIKQALGDKWGVAAVLSNLGSVSLGEGDIQAARSFLQESLKLRRELGDRWSLADSLESLATLALVEGQPERAATLWGAAESIRAAIGTTLAAGECARHERGVTAVRQQLAQAAIDAAWAAGQQLTDEAAVAYALGEMAE